MITIWQLQFIGLILGFVGTILMILGGLGGFIRVYNKDDSRNHHEPGGFVEFGVEDDTSGWVAQFKTPKYPRWRIRSNYGGILLLGLGFAFQLAALWLDP
jgi:hypothetical protein